MEWEEWEAGWAATLASSRYESTVCLIEGFAIIGMINWFFRSLEFIHRADVFVFDRGTGLDIPQGPLTAAKIETAITGLKPHMGPLAFGAIHIILAAPLLFC